jgi:hypothetical protein
MPKKGKRAVDEEEAAANDTTGPKKKIFDMPETSE